MAMKRQKGSRYEFPTRILARAERFISGILAKRGIKKEDARYEERVKGLFNFVQELLFVRLMENNWILDDGWLKAEIEKNGLSGLLERLNEFNQILGLKVFFPNEDRDLEISLEELSGFIQELYQFMPKNIQPEILGGLIEKLGILGSEQAPFWTPQSLVDLMVEESFRILGWDQTHLEGQEFLVLDPSFGAGNFLLGLLRRMISIEEGYYAKRPSGLFYPLVRLPDLSRSIEPELKIELFKKHLLGLDLVPEAKLTAIRALIVFLHKGKPLGELKEGGLAFLDEHLAIGDFLIDQPLQEQIELFLPERFQKIAPFNFSESFLPHHQAMLRGGFELIIGNPPWLSLKGKRRISPYSPEAVKWLIGRYHADSYRPNLFEMFIHRAIELLKDQGLNCFLVPDRLAENLQYQRLREFMIEQGEIARLHFREPFPGVVSDTLIYWFRKKKPSVQKKILASDALRNQVFISSSKFIRKGGALEKKLAPPALSLIKKLKTRSRGKIADYFNAGVGLIARPGSIHSEKINSLEQPLVKGENVQPWKITGHYFFEFHSRNLLGGTIRYSKLTAKQRILVRKTGARLIAGIDHSGYLVEQSAYFLIPKPGKRIKYDLEFFLALINSRLLNFYYRNYLVTNPESTPQLKKFHLEQLPVKRLNLKDHSEKELYEELVSLAKKIMESKEDAEKKAWEEELNRLVFKIYQLSDEEMELVERAASIFA